MSNHYDLAGKHALVTGATQGIGLAIAKLLAESGARVVLHGRTQDECDAAARDIPNALPLACELTDARSRAEFCARANTILDGKLHALVHNAGVYPQNNLEGQSLEQWGFVMNLNVESQFHITQLLRPALIAAGSAGVVLISSVVTRLGRGDSPAYTASKAAQIGLARHLASELGKHHVRVNCVLPGLVDTPTSRVARPDDHAFDEFAHKRQMVPVPIKPAHIAEAVVFLCSPGAAAITAAGIDVNGGLAVGGI